MDGVLYTAEDFIADAYIEAIKLSGLKLPIPSTSQIMQQIGKPIWDIYSNLFPGITKEQMLEFRKHTRKCVIEMVKEKRGRIFPGITDVINNLSQKYTLTVCSNGGGGYIDAILTTHGIKKYFIPVLTLDSENLKNKAELLQAYISKNGNNNHSWAMIGDRKTDYDAAVHNNCAFIGCTWGHADDGELAEAEIIISSPSEIEPALETLNKNLLI